MPTENNKESEKSNIQDNNANNYPTLTVNRGSDTSENYQTASSENKPNKIPWFKVTLLGLAIQLIVLTLLSVFRGVLNPINSIGVAFLYSAVSGLTPIIYLLTIPAAYNRLKRWDLESPLLIASSSAIFLYGIYFAGQKIPTTTSLTAYLAGYVQTDFERLLPALTSVVFIGVGPLIYLLTACITNKIRFKPVAIILLVLVIATPYIFANTYKPQSIIPRLPKVKDVDWKLLPAYLPAGLRDIGLHGDSVCAEQDTKSAWYDCTYSFEDYPGYLSSSTQIIINESLLVDRNPQPDFYYQPTNFFKVTVIRDDKLLDAYKYNEEKCDLRGLEGAGTSPRNRDGSVIVGPEAKSQRCVKVTTPAGKDLYYDSYQNYSIEDFEPVPVDYYFEQAGSVVIIRVGDQRPLADRVSSLYYTDTNFQPEFYKFVDSFK